MNISRLKGIGEQTAQKFAKLGIADTDDLLNFFPRSYEHFHEPVLVSDISHEGIYAITVIVLDQPLMNFHSKSKSMSVNLSDTKGNRLKAKWYHSAYLSGKIRKGCRYVFRGKVSFFGASLVMNQPAIFQVEEYALQHTREPLSPIYSLTQGLSNNTIRKAVTQCFEKDLIPPDYLPAEMLSRLGFCDYYHAIYKAHFPKTESEACEGRKRLAFDEFFLFTLGIRRCRMAGRITNDFVCREHSISETFISKLPYRLTNAQTKVYNEILKDFESNYAANRLIQGDVGSGKTILSFLAMLEMASIGAQAVLMAPTEVLATQHYEALCALLSEQGLPYQCALLTGSVKEKDKKLLREQIVCGEIDFIVGTHAVITEKVEYHQLGLVITDEQHRFGVLQREALAKKGEHPHVLVMSATPIPRSLAVILYGDLDISIVDEKPANRLPIKNCVVGTEYRPNAYRLMQREIQNGHQVYAICAMAEPPQEGEEAEGNDELMNVVDYAEKLRGIMPPSIRIEYLHGKMKPADKNRIMEAFSHHEIDIIVSTTVIEVGIDVPNSTIMFVENAERFGLSTLHQLRGRVGRGDAQAYCIFMSDTKASHTQERLGILKESNDGFYIAEQDLRLRGPGDLLGVRQSGDLGFRLGDIYADANELRLAGNEAAAILQEDPLLTKPEHQALKKRLEEYSRNHLLQLSI